MKRQINMLLIALLSIFMIACTTMGNNKFAQNSAHIQKDIIDGKTTKNQIKKMIGDPDDVDFATNGREKWVYKYKKSRAKLINYIPIANSFAHGTNDEITKLVILFNKRDVVTNHVLAKTKDESMAIMTTPDDRRHTDNL